MWHQVTREDQRINGKAWEYSIEIASEEFLIRYWTHCGQWVEKSLTADDLGCLPQPDDIKACILAGIYAVMEETKEYKPLIRSC
ncbi:hypothetical protein H0A36_17615 [Endozoicomonas sp. SM1973]|uniref:Uncharacterized protein n=1 Tax=Spartinivicinus marinus TaxID=2994442 RepID=A0A853IFA1_9GAMM|nr:hypothetical protein [Spartinivicinus marinus]MCX4030192.1 hypothetical protein [Spartinivicinus marinus]NYZ67835.1 hypothetical protein [Spartinivicinus marinus]